MKIMATSIIINDNPKTFNDDLERVVTDWQDNYKYEVEIQFTSTDICMRALVIGRTRREDNE